MAVWAERGSWGYAVELWRLPCRENRRHDRCNGPRNDLSRERPLKPQLFEHVAPRTLSDAVAALVSDPGAMVLAGGQSLIPALNLRLMMPTLLVDIAHINGLRSVRIENGAIVVGAMARHRDVELHPEVRRAQPLLPAALVNVGHVPIRNRGTTVGSLCHADAAAEMPLVLLLTGGSVLAVGPNGSRVIAAEDFFSSHFTTTRSPDEIVTEARFPVLPQAAGWSFQEVARRGGDHALAAVGAILELGPSGTVERVCLAACGMAARPERLIQAEKVLIGGRLTDVKVAAAAEAASAAVTAPDDMHASRAYRRRAVRALVKRAIAEAHQRAAAA
jgi:CO/xanthine dehydrogenase FAD-binding subunit